MLRSTLILAMALGLSAPAIAQTRAEVTVALGASLQAKAADYGARDLQDLRQDLARTVRRALEWKGGGVLRPRTVDLIIEDARPNRPTFAQMGRNTALSMQSISLGGARISGKVVDRDGVAHPLAIAFYENDLRQEAGAAPWSDAQRAFDLVADGIVSGRLDRK